MMKRLPLLLFFFVLLPFTANADCKAWWDPATLANTSHTNINLIFEGKTKATIPTHWVRQINSIKQKIDASSGIYTKFFICDSQDPNAFAWRDSGQNTVALTLGMYNLLGNDWDAYAAILGHENAHLVKNHGKKPLRDAGIGILQILAGIALEALLIEKTNTSTGLGFDVAALGASSVYAFYNRDEEHEADKYGLIYAQRAGFDPRGAIRLHSKLSQSSNFLSSHPSSVDRMAMVRMAIANQTNRANDRTSAKNDVGTLKSGGAGLVIVVKAKHGYYIATQTELIVPAKGMKVYIVNDANKKIPGDRRKKLSAVIFRCFLILQLMSLF